MAIQVWKIQLVASDELELTLDVHQNGTVLNSQLRGIGGPELLSLLQEWRAKLNGLVSSLEVPSGNSQPEIMLRELLNKAKGSWQEPYKEAELCHCRAVPTKVVHQAIVSGAHTPELVSRWTSASTACGNCRKDVVAMLGALVCDSKNELTKIA